MWNLAEKRRFGLRRRRFWGSRARHQQLALSEDLQRERQELFERQRVAGLQQQAELHAQQRVLHEARLHEQRQQEAALLLAQQMQPTNESTKSQAWS